MNSFPIVFLAGVFLFGCQPNSSSKNEAAGPNFPLVDSADMVKEGKGDLTHKSGPSSPQVKPNSAARFNRTSPFPEEDRPPLQFEIEAGKAKDVYLESGTEIHIPSGAFLFPGGKRVRGVVQLEFNEWHSLSEIFASGIPMEFSENGVGGALSSAGMFEIYAHQNGTELKMNPKAPIVVNVASTRKENDFLNLTLNPKSKKWEELGPAAAPEPKVKTSAFTQRFLPELLHPYFVYLRQEVGQPEKAILRFKKWKVDLHTRYIDEISALAQCKFHETKLDFSEVQQLLLSITDDPSAQHTGNYRIDNIDFTPEGQVILGLGMKSCTLSVQPAPNQGLDAAFYPNFLEKFEYQHPYTYHVLTDHCYIVNGQELYEYPSNNITELVLRTFVLDGFGIKNIDKFVPLPSQMVVNPKLPKQRKENAYVYYVADLNSKTIWMMSANKLRINPNAPYKIWAINSSDVLVADNLFFRSTDAGADSIQVDFKPIPLKTLLKQLDNDVAMARSSRAR